MQENKKSSLLPKVPRSLSSSWPRHSEQSSEPPVYSLHAPLTSTALSAAASGPSILSLMSAAAVCLACSRHTGHRCHHHHLTWNCMGSSSSSPSLLPSWSCSWPCPGTLAK